MAKQTSRVFACWRALRADLAATVWTPHPVTGIVPRVSFAMTTPFEGEAIVLPGRVPRSSSKEWATMGSPGQNETFRLLVGVRTWVQGTTEDEAFDRLEELCDLVQTTLRSSATGKPAGPALLALDIPTAKWRVDDPLPAIFPHPDNGFAGECSFEVEFSHRI